VLVATWLLTWECSRFATWLQKIEAQHRQN
jgi:hypothetical protein